jgi:hypothetical protein
LQSLSIATLLVPKRAVDRAAEQHHGGGDGLGEVDQNANRYESHPDVQSLTTTVANAEADGGENLVT